MVTTGQNASLSTLVEGNLRGQAEAAKALALVDHGTQAPDALYDAARKVVGTFGDSALRGFLRAVQKRIERETTS